MLMGAVNIIIYFLCFAALVAAFILIPKSKKTKKFSVILLSVALLIEIFVCNFHSFHIVFGEYEKSEINLKDENVDITVHNAPSQDTDAPENTAQNITIIITDIGQKVGTLKLDCDMPLADGELKNTDYVNVNISAKDETQSAAYRASVANGQLVRDDEHSSYIVLDLSGEVSELKIELTSANDTVFTLKGITLNESIPVNFSTLRLFIFALIIFFINFFKTEKMKASFGERERFCRVTVFSVTGVFVALAVIITVLYQYEMSGEFFSEFKSTTGNQISQELVDAFKAGQVSLLDKPSEELLAMENPYDWSARSALGVSAKWDHLLFEGNYYSYYGIAPVFLLFLPYNLITGYYFPTPEAVMIFGIIGIIFLTLAILEFARLFGKKISNRVIISTIIIAQLSSGIWYCFCSPLFYEIAQSSGFMFTTAGFYFLFKSRVIGEGQIKYKFIVLSTLCFALSVLCRPTLVLYCLVSLIFLAWGFFKRRREASEFCLDDKKTMRIETTKYLFACFTCYVIIGGAQMLYNYARFGSFFDFGIQYSLTINDFTRSQYHTDFVMIGLYNYLLAFPRIQPDFPYVFSNFSTLDTNGYYFVANRNAVGLLWRSLPVFGYFGAGVAWKQLTKKEKLMALTLLLTTCIVVPLIIIFSIWESGYGVRYCVDFAWQLILGGAAILYLIYCRVANNQTKALIEKFFILSVVVALIINGAMIYDYMHKGNFLATQFLSFERLFDFWK